MILPSGITKLEFACFAYCASLEYDLGTLPKSITSISWGFTDASHVFGIIDLPNLLTLDGPAFGGTLITEVVNLGKISYVPDLAFDEDNSTSKTLKKVVLPSTLTELGAAFRRCRNLEILIIHAVAPPTLTNVNTFNDTTKVQIYVPDAAVSNYQAATNWSAFASRIKPLSELP